jgi:hypothetical protein
MALQHKYDATSASLTSVTADRDSLVIQCELLTEQQAATAQQLSLSEADRIQVSHDLIACESLCSTLRQTSHSMITQLSDVTKEWNSAESRYEDLLLQYNTLRDSSTRRQQRFDALRQDNTLLRQQRKDILQKQRQQRQQQRQQLQKMRGDVLSGLSKMDEPVLLPADTDREQKMQQLQQQLALLREKQQQQHRGAQEAGQESPAEQQQQRWEESAGEPAIEQQQQQQQQLQPEPVVCCQSCSAIQQQLQKQQGLQALIAEPSAVVEYRLPPEQERAYAATMQRQQQNIQLADQRWPEGELQRQQQQQLMVQRHCGESSAPEQQQRRVSVSTLVPGSPAARYDQKCELTLPANPESEEPAATAANSGCSSVCLEPLLLSPNRRSPVTQPGSAAAAAAAPAPAVAAVVGDLTRSTSLREHWGEVGSNYASNSLVLSSCGYADECCPAAAAATGTSTVNSSSVVNPLFEPSPAAAAEAGKLSLALALVVQHISQQQQQFEQAGAPAAADTAAASSTSEAAAAPAAAAEADVVAAVAQANLLALCDLRWGGAL